MNDFDKITRWVGLGAIILDGVAKMIDTLTKKEKGEYSPEHADAEIEAIESDLENARSVVSDVFRD